MAADGPLLTLTDNTAPLRVRRGILRAIIMTTAAMIPMKWSGKDTNGSIEHCVCCGRKLTGTPVYVEVIDGGGQVAAPGLDPDQTDAGYMGFFPVGRHCAKKHFRGYTHDSI